MRALFDFAAPVGGMDTLNRERAAALLWAGVECRFLYRAGGNPVDGYGGARVDVTNDAGAIRGIVSGWRPDIAVVTCIASLAWSLRSLGLAAPIILEFQGIGRPQDMDAALAPLAERAKGLCDAVVSPPSPALSSAIGRHFGFLPRFSLRNPIDADAFRAPDIVQPDHPVLGWVGRTEPGKNLPDFLRIARRVMSDVPSARASVLLSSPTSEGDVRAAMGEAAAAGIVDFVDFGRGVPRSAMPEWYAKVAASGGLLVSTSRAEGFSYSALEAMCAGCPVLCTDSDGVRPMIEHGATGMYFGHGDIEGAAAAAIALMRDATLRDRIRAGALAKARNEFSPGAYAAGFISMAEATAAVRRSRPATGNVGFAVMARPELEIDARMPGGEDRGYTVVRRRRGG